MMMDVDGVIFILVFVLYVLLAVASLKIGSYLLLRLQAKWKIKRASHLLERLDRYLTK
jgi:hypothetical protein